MVFKLRPCLLQLKGINVLWTYSSIGLVYFINGEIKPREIAIFQPFKRYNAHTK
jgi:hypothetical protein